MPKAKAFFHSKLFLDSKSFLILVILALLASAYVFLSVDIQNPLGSTTRPWNYKFVYFNEGKIGVYDLLGNSEEQISFTGNKVLQFGWSKDGRLVYKDDLFNLFLINEKGEPKKLAAGMKGYFFWKDDNSGIYAANYEPTGYVQGGNWQKTYFINLSGKMEEIPVKTYEKVEGEQVVKQNDNSIASYDNKFLSQTNYTDPNVSRIALIDTKLNRNYSLPSKSKVKVSGGESYIGFTQGDGYRNLVIFPFSSVAANSFRSPIYEKEQVRDYAWLDDNRLILVYEEENKDLTYNYIYLLVNVKTNDEKVLYTIKDSDQGIAEVFISPNLRRFGFREEKRVGEGEDIVHKSYLVVLNISNGKEVQRIPFEAGDWSEPIK
jgi:hypothetical protein